MYKKGWDYPLHLGVTEAGEGEDGRMKSAIGRSTTERGVLEVQTQACLKAAWIQGGSGRLVSSLSNHANPYPMC